MKYEFVKRSSKRKRDDEELSGSDDEPGNKKRRFNTMARCSLKKLANCIKLLQEQHLVVLSSGGLGHLKDFKIKCNINRWLICFLMYHIDPHTMTLDLDDGNKVLQITSLGIHLLFGLPMGGNSSPRPSDNYAEALRTLKDELGVPMNQGIKTDEFRKMLVALADDKDNDTKAIKVFGLNLYNKFIFPGYGMRITREATMVEDFDFVKLKDVNLCQLVVDELRRAIFAW
jgi:hypothetical protein